MAINVLFDRLEKIVPQYVPRTRALILSTIAGLVVFMLGLNPVIDDKRNQGGSENDVKRFRWIVMLGVLLVVSPPYFGPLAPSSCLSARAPFLSFLPAPP